MSSRLAASSTLALAQSLLALTHEMAALGERAHSHRRTCQHLTRRAKMLAPLFEEVRDVGGPLPDEAVVAFQALRSALAAARGILQDCCSRSRLWMVFERETVTQRVARFHSELSSALAALPMDLMAVSEEVQEQVQLVQAQLSRARPLDDSHEEQLLRDLQTLLHHDRLGGPAPANHALPPLPESHRVDRGDCMDVDLADARERRESAAAMFGIVDISRRCDGPSQTTAVPSLASPATSYPSSFPPPHLSLPSPPSIDASLLDPVIGRVGLTSLPAVTAELAALHREAARLRLELAGIDGALNAGPMRPSISSSSSSSSCPSEGFQAADNNSSEATAMDVCRGAAALGAAALPGQPLPTAEHFSAASRYDSAIPARGPVPGATLLPPAAPPLGAEQGPLARRRMVEGQLAELSRCAALVAQLQASLSGGFAVPPSGSAVSCAPRTSGTAAAAASSWRLHEGCSAGATSAGAPFPTGATAAPCEASAAPPACAAGGSSESVAHWGQAAGYAGAGSAGEGSSVSVQQLELQGSSEGSSDAPGVGSGATLRTAAGGAVAVPEDFRCPISLELMRDPVIVATGQTYDRPFIEQWLRNGHRSCPKTQQLLPQPSPLIPNYSLRSLIEDWCTANHVVLPHRAARSSGGYPEGLSQHSDVASDALMAARRQGAAVVEPGTVLLLRQQLQSPRAEARRLAAAEVRLLAKKSEANRAAIAEGGVIAILVGLLRGIRDAGGADAQAEEDAVTALLNLSINNENKGEIVAAQGIAAIVGVLERGVTMESRENAAAALHSLAAVDENKIAIGQSGAIPPLVALLQTGTARGKKDAATALYNLCHYAGNRGRAVRAGLVEPLVALIRNRESGLVDEALANLSLLASSAEGRAALGGMGVIPVLVGLMTSGPPRTKECAAAVLALLCTNSKEMAEEAVQCGAVAPLHALLRGGTQRAKRKAAQLLQHLREADLLHVQPGRGARGGVMQQGANSL